MCSQFPSPSQPVTPAFRSEPTEPHRPVEFSLDQCLKCNICTSACPVAAVTDRFPGPKYAGPQAARFRQALPGTNRGGRAASHGKASLFGAPEHASVDYCSGCRVCNLVCPAGVKIAEMNARARAVLVEEGRIPLILRLRNNLLARAATLGAVAQPVAPLANWVMGLKLARWLAEATLHIHRDAPFPPFSSEKFTTWFMKHRQETSRRASTAAGRKPVVYFHGCSTQYYEPRIGKAAVRVLEANGFEVIVPAQNCCGLPLLSNGEFDAARRYHLNNVRRLVSYARQGIPIVGTSTSCTLTLKEEAPELLDLTDADTRLVAESTYDFNEFLLALYEMGELNTDFRALPLSLPYHVPCQYRAHRLGRPGMALLDLIPGLKTVDSRAACCGIAGTYGYKQEKYAIAMAVGQPLFDFVQGSGSPADAVRCDPREHPTEVVSSLDKQPPLVICDSETCRWQITHATSVPSIHPVELLAAAYRLPIEGAIAGVLSDYD